MFEVMHTPKVASSSQKRYLEYKWMLWLSEDVDQGSCPLFQMVSSLKLDILGNNCSLLEE